jgi:hypothetical protein
LSVRIGVEPPVLRRLFVLVILVVPSQPRLDLLKIHVTPADEQLA